VESSLYQISLVAAFGAGMVALFAPCCISFLLPSYFGNIFKERRRVLLMTLVYSVGIFTVMLPIVLGAKALSLFFFRFHNQSYLAGGVFLLAMAGMTLLGIKLPVPHFAKASRGAAGELDVGSTYTLGLFSGVTSACCAPVLLGVMGISALSATWWGAVGVGLTYVLGMVFPLYAASYFLERGNILAKPMWRKVVGQVRLAGKTYVIFLANVAGAVIFAGLGLVTVYLALTGKLGMPARQSLAFQAPAGGPVAEVIFVIIMGVILAKLIRKGVRRNEA
jgi:cytochrome c-type biogenesis protein